MSIDMKNAGIKMYLIGINVHFIEYHLAMFMYFAGGFVFLRNTRNLRKREEPRVT